MVNDDADQCLIPFIMDKGHLISIDVNFMGKGIELSIHSFDRGT